MKPFRIFLGLTVIVVSIWLIVTEQLSGASADATINAQLVSLRSPIAGELSLSPLPSGARLSRDQEVGAVRDARADAVRLNDLELEVSLARAVVTGVEAKKQVIDSAIAELHVRGQAYQAARIKELEIELAAAKERLSIVSGQNYTPEADIIGLTTLLPEDEPTAPFATIAINYARERVAVLENELAAAQADIYLGDGFNDAPFSDQRRTDLLRESDFLTHAAAEASSRLVAYVSRTQAERLRVNRFERVTLRSPASGILYQMLVTTGEIVERGDPVAVIVDCTTVFVTLSVTENVYDRLSSGDAATFRPQGSGKIFDGSIYRLAGSGASRVYEDLAIAPSAQHLERFDVTLEVPMLREDPELACAIGRTGRAYFDERPLDWLRNLFLPL